MAPSEETSSGGSSEGTSQPCSESTCQQDADNLPKQEEDEDEVRQKCLYLLNELVSRTEEASQHRQPHMEGGPVQCRLPLTKVSLALQAYVNRATTTHSPNVFQGQKTAPLPNASDESCDAITPFTPSSTKLPGSPSIASATPANKSQETSTAKVVRAPRPFLFQVELMHQVVGEDGQKWYVCDICQNKYHHCFSLKRHYLRSHINHRYLTERDIFNYSIVVNDHLPSLDKKDSGVMFPSLYCCQRCMVFFDVKDELIRHLSLHPEDLKCSSGDEITPGTSKSLEQEIASTSESISADSSQSHTSKHVSHCSVIAHDLPEFPKPRPASQLECLYCDKTFSTMTMHKRHMHRSHPQQSSAHLSSSQEKHSHHKCTFCTAEDDVPTSQDEAKSTDSLKYACSICRKVFDDYVAKCRHHRKVHKGMQSLSSIFGGVRSPSMSSDSRSQSPAPDVCYKKSVDNAVEDTVNSVILPQLSQKICDDSSQKTVCLLHETSDTIGNMCSSLHKTDVDESRLSQNIDSNILDSVFDSVNDKNTADGIDEHLPKKIVSNLEKLVGDSKSSLQGLQGEIISDVNNDPLQSVNNLNEVTSEMNDLSNMEKTVSDSGNKHINNTIAQSTSQETNASENTNCMPLEEPPASVGNSNEEDFCDLPERIVGDLIDNSVPQMHDNEKDDHKASGVIIDVEEKAIKSKDVIEDNNVTNKECSESEKKSNMSTIDEVVESVVRKYSVSCETEDSDKVKSNCAKKTARSTIDETLDSVIKNCSATDGEKRNSIDEILDFVVNNYEEDSTGVPKRSSIDETLDYVIKNFQPFSKPVKFQRKIYKRPLKKNLKIEPSLTLSKKLVKRGRKTLLGEQKVNHKLMKNDVNALLEKNRHLGDDVSKVEPHVGQNFTKSVNSIQKGNPKALEEESNKQKLKKNSKLSGKNKTVEKILVKTSKTSDENYKPDKKNHTVNKISLGKTKSTKVLSEEMKVLVNKKRNQNHSVGDIDGNVKELDKVKQKIAKKNHKLSDSENEIKKSKQKSAELEITTKSSNLEAAEGIHSVLDGLVNEFQEKSNNEFVETKSKQMEAGRVLRSSLISTAKNSESPETSEIQDRRGRSLRSSSAPGIDPDGNRSVKKRLPKSEEVANVKNEIASDLDAMITRGTRLRKFSRRVRGDMVQEKQHLDPETLFYCRIAGNIRENLLHHLDGKLESEEGYSNERCKEQENVLSQEDKHHHHHNHHRIPWEKFNFPKNYDGRCKEGMSCLASYIKDMSHLDISTQLTMRQNFQRLSMAPPNSKPLETSIVELGKDDVVGFSKGLCLNAKVLTEQPRRRSLRSAASRGREMTSTMLGGAASTFTASAAMRRWSSADNVAGALVELSGEWIRPRSYICAACGLLFSDLWDLEDHKYSQHPNVWCTHYEFEQATLEQTSDSRLSLRDLCRRFLLVRDVVDSVPLLALSTEVKCTKCERGFSALPELHRHILECGGDTTWMLLPSPSSNGRRSRKWRPFGSRRRRQQGSHRRGMKRNIPNTPVKQYYRNNKHRTQGGDSDSIQRMLANLPAKRATRRVIQFSEDEMKTRSQGTMHSIPMTSGVPPSPHRVTQKPDPGDQSRKLGRSPKKVVKGQITVRKVVRSKLALGAREEEETVSPVMNKQEAALPTVDVSEDAEPPAIHRSRNRKKPVAEVAKVQVDEFDVDISNVGNAETSNILAAMRIALLEGVITEKMPTKKRKPGEPMTLKKKAKVGQSNLEEQFLRNKGYTHPDEVSGEPIICKGCGMQFDNGSAEMRHRKTCIYLPGGDESNSAVKRKKKVSPTGRVKKSDTSELSTRSLSASPVRNRKKKQDRKEIKRSSSLGTVEEKKKKIVKRKSLLKEKKTNAVSPATSDIDDRMPELQKEEPLDNLKTQTPSPKLGEDLCDIPILSPVGCEPPADEPEDKQGKSAKSDKLTATGKQIEDRVTKTVKKQIEKDMDSDDDIPLVQKLEHLKQSPSNDVLKIKEVVHRKDSSSDDDVPLVEKVASVKKSSNEVNIPQVVKVTHCKKSSSYDDVPLLEKVASSKKSEESIPLVEEVACVKESNSDDDVHLVEKIVNHKGYSNDDSICPFNKEDNVPIEESSLDVELSCHDEFSGNYCDTSLIENNVSSKQSSINSTSEVENMAFREEFLGQKSSPLDNMEFMSDSEIPLVEKLLELEHSCKKQSKQSSKCSTNTKSSRKELSPKKTYTDISSETSKEAEMIPDSTIVAREDTNLKDERDKSEVEENSSKQIDSTVSQEHIAELNDSALLQEALPVSPKKQKRRVIRRRNSTPSWDRKRKSVSRVQETTNKIQHPIFEEFVNEIVDPIEELVSEMQDPVEVVGKIPDPHVQEEDSSDELLPISKLKEVIQKKTISNEDCIKEIENMDDSKLEEKIDEYQLEGCSSNEIIPRSENNLDIQQEELVSRDVLQPVQKKKRNQRNALPLVQSEQNLEPEKVKRRVCRDALCNSQVKETRRRGRSKSSLFTVQSKQGSELQNMDEEQNQLQEENKTKELVKKDDLEAEEVIENFLQNDLDSGHSCLQIGDLVESFENELRASVDVMEDNSGLEQVEHERLEEMSRENTEKESEQVTGEKKEEEKDSFQPIECLTITKKKGLRHVIRKQNSRKTNLIETSNLIDQEHIVMPCSSILDSEGEQLMTSFVEADSKCDFPGDSDHLMSVAEDTNISVCEETSNLIGGEENITDVLSAVIGGEDSGERDGIHLLIQKEKEMCEVVAEIQDEPLRQARRTRCNTSYEELYAWSDVTTETEDSSQDLPDASIMTALCQEGEATYEQLAAILASGEHLFPSMYTRKKKKKLRNNSRQYRNGQLRRRRRRKQKLKTKLLKKSKRVNEFIVTDIETGQEESQDSCESTTVHAQPGGDEISKPVRRKRKKKIAGEMEKTLYCDVCDKNYSTNYSLMKHKQSITHRKCCEQQNTGETLPVSDEGMPVVLQTVGELHENVEETSSVQNKESSLVLEDPSVLENIEDSTVFQNIEESLELENIEKASSPFENKETNSANCEESETSCVNDEGDLDKGKQMSVSESGSLAPVEDKSHDQRSCPKFENVTVSVQSNVANLETGAPSKSNMQSSFIALGGSAGNEFNQNSAQWTDWSQQNWSSEQENGNQWLYGNQWNWGRDMGWNAESSQDDGTFFQSSNASLGSILDSVNQILDNERSGDGLTSGSEYQSYMDLLQPESCEDGTGGLRELQQAMGATDEEMAMLQQLGEGNWPLEDADIMDLDNQKTASSLVQQDTSSAATMTMKDVQHKQSLPSTSSADTRESRVLVGRGGLRNQDILLAHYESKDMVCPVCSRRFLGLSALRAHLNAAHNSSTRHHTQNDVSKRSRIGNSRSGGETDPVRHVCEVCKELLPDEQGLADHVEVAHTERNKPTDHRSEGLGHGKSSSSGAGGGDEGLRSHMTSALGGLLTRALNNFLGKNRSQPSPPATQTQSPPASSPKPSQVQSMSKLFSRSVKTTGRRHSSGPVDEQPFNCMDCDVRFSSESNRNRHIARAHRNIQYRRLSTDSTVTTEENTQPVTTQGAEMSVTPPLCEVVPEPPEPAQVEESPMERRTRVKIDMMEKVDGLNEEESIKAKAVAALRALNSKDRRTRNGFAGNNGPVLWTSVSRNKSRGNNSEERFRFPLVRKTPPSVNRFASLVEKKKKRATADVVMGQAKENIEDIKDPLPSIAVPISYDVYEFQDEVEQVKPLGEYSLRGKASGSDQQEEIPLQDVMEATDNIEISKAIGSGICGTASRIPEIMDEVSQSSEDIVVKDTEASQSKTKPTLKKRLFSKKKRWHRIIVDSGEETSDAETLTESQHEKSRGVKRRHSIPAGVLVEDRQSAKKTKIKQPSRGSQRRSTKTDLLMSVFAKSRQRYNTASAARPVSMFNSSYESESDSSSLAAGNLGVSSEDEGKQPHQHKHKISAL